MVQKRRLRFAYVGCKPSAWCADALLSVGEHNVELEPEGELCTDVAGLLLLEKVEPTVLSFVERWSRRGKNRVLAVVGGTERLTQAEIWSLLRHGAVDVLTWEKSSHWGETIHARLERWAEIDEIRESPLVRDNLVGSSPVWSASLRSTIETARYTAASVLILGESGTGKELVARLIHTLDPRPKKRDLVVLDCTTISPHLSGSEFFGHERGAFTGAVSSRDGVFALADGGTLFLDEVGELPLTLQAELLRVIQERRYKRIGSNTWKETTFRLICATHRDLEALEAEGGFRRDFYYRIAATRCRLPPLRERKEDIPELARSFLAQLAGSRSAPDLDGPVESFLRDRAYRGNVRDLKQLVARLYHRHVGNGKLTVGDIPEEEWPQGAACSEAWRDEPLRTLIRLALDQGTLLKQIGREAEREAVRRALEVEEGNLQRAARRLGVSDRALQMRRAMERAELDTPERNGAPLGEFD